MSLNVLHRGLIRASITHTLTKIKILKSKYNRLVLNYTNIKMNIKERLGTIGFVSGGDINYLTL